MYMMKVVQFYPYRTGYVRGNTIQFPREWMETFENELARISGNKRDNHTCYIVRFDGYPDERIRAFMFTDSLMIMGDRVDVKNW